ncbi:MAG: hypothetical protein C4548_09250 [Desulfobacteraceae bacterium]|jgi:hypothetical protein|nr:MAG: hypothetical protein C4548_09250 [Desulfobacteraceae bacterium]
MGMTRINFHIGAHKTASTHLQMTLAKCTFRPGVRYVPLNRLRTMLTSPVRKKRPHLPWHRWYNGTWLFSDENILGTTANALRMYPDPAHALRYFRDCELRVFLCVRCYDTFLASAYGERLWRHPYQPFAGDLPVRRWPDIVRELKNALSGTPIHIWRYEDYREHARAITRFYADDGIEEFGEPLQHHPKSGFSGRAVEEMSRFKRRRPIKYEVLRIRAEFPIGPRYPRFNPWTERQKTYLRKIYAHDLMVLEDMAAVWKPGAALCPD